MISLVFAVVLADARPAALLAPVSFADVLADARTVEMLALALDFCLLLPLWKLSVVNSTIGRKDLQDLLPNPGPVL